MHPKIWDHIAADENILAEQLIEVALRGDPVDVEALLAHARLLEISGPPNAATSALERAAARLIDAETASASYLEIICELISARRLTKAQIQYLILALDRAHKLSDASKIGLAAWDTGDREIQRSIVFMLPGRLASIGRLKDAARIYYEAVDFGLSIGDLRLRTDQSTLASVVPDFAAKLYVRDRRAFETVLKRTESQNAIVWQPVTDSLGSVMLRGAARNGAVSAVFSIAAGRDVRLVVAERVSPGAAFEGWQALVEDLLPGVSYKIVLTPEGGAASGAFEFRLPLTEIDGAVTGRGDVVGLDAAVVSGRVAAFSDSARYRFEYGASASALDQATPWDNMPPPRSGRFVQRLYRQTGEWLPTCLNAHWSLPDTGFPVLSIGAPFSKDRNQLNGIGAHEMPVGIAWSQPHAVRASGNHGRRCGPVGGGVQDLRDGEISFTLAGNGLQQHGAALHFWISHTETDARGVFSSQWALTGSPIPDDVLAGPVLRKVSLRLSNDPLMWTYTGNNPDEQGERASRYRRAPLDATLRANDAPFVLIFAFGENTRPPQGALMFSDAELLYRDHSVLSHAAGAVLTQFPAGAAADPLWLTSGENGEESRIWTSAPSTAAALEFRWQLKKPVTGTHFQINQHPYWPAKDVEILAEDAEGSLRCVWRGVLPEGRPDRDEMRSIVADLPPGPRISAVMLRILSGYHAERCGLDSFEFYGADAAFQADGQFCSVSAEIPAPPHGRKIFYRVVLEDAGEMITGEIMDLTLPATAAPLLLEMKPLVRLNDPAGYAVRANAMGFETEVWGELEAADGGIFKGPAVSLGSQPTGRHIYYMPHGLPVGPGIFRLRARNSAGEAVLTTQREG